MTGVMAKDSAGKVSVKQSMGAGPFSTGSSTGVGLAVGSLIGLLGGPGGVAVAP